MGTKKEKMLKGKKISAFDDEPDVLAFPCDS